MDELLDFLNGEDAFFIEAEAKLGRMQNFINEYNEAYSDTIDLDSNGIIILQDDANKWGLELRLYVSSCPPENVRKLGFTHNNDYKAEYSYRLNNNDIVGKLFDVGYRIGVN